MKSIDSKMIWYGALLIIGVILNIAAKYIDGENDFWSVLGILMIVMSALRFIQIGRMKKDSNYAKKVTIKNQDERNVFISMKARANTFYYSILIGCLLVFILYIFDQKEIGEILGLVICGQLIIYFLTYFQLSKRY